MNTVVRERRAESRKPASLLVTYASEMLALTGVATDLSPAGLFVETELLDTVGTEAFLRLSDGAHGRIEALARVVRTVAEPGPLDPGMGLRFVELGPEAVGWIRRYCRTFETSIRVVLAEAEAEHLERASRAVESVGARPLCLVQELSSVAAVARLQPHLVVLGEEGEALARALVAHPGLTATSVYLAGEGDLGPLRERATEANAAGALSWADERSLLRAVDAASRRLGRGPVLPPGGAPWLN